MPISKAYNHFPDAVVLPVNMKFNGVGRIFKFVEIYPYWQVNIWNEIFLDSVF